MLNLSILAAVLASAAAAPEPTPLMPMCSCYLPSLTQSARMWRDEAKTGDTTLRRMRWFVGTAKTVANAESAADPAAPRVWPPKPPREVTTFQVDKAWTRDKGAPSPATVRVVVSRNALCPYPEYKPGNTYLVFGAPASDGTYNFGVCEWAYLASDTASQTAIKALGKPSWRRKRWWFWPF